MSQISVNNLTFYYEGSYDNVFENVSFQIDTDWKLGFIGRNGKGKTTFLNLLMGKYEYVGNISASVPFDYFPFAVSDKEKNTIDIIAEIDSNYELWKVCLELNELKVDGDVLYRSFSTLSNGEQTKVLLALLFSRENHFLLIDEPANHLDMESRELLAEYLNKKKGFILVSHDRKFMDSCVDHVLVINRTDIQVQQGNFSSWQENKKRQDAYELSENERLKKDIRRLNDAAAKAAQWADHAEETKIGKKSAVHEKSIDLRAYIGEKSRRMQQRRKNLERRQQREIEEKSSLLKNVENVEDLKLLPLTHYKEKLVIMKDCRLAYDDREIVRHFDMEVKRGEQIFLQGRNGCGKSSILKAILHQAGFPENRPAFSFPALKEGTIELPNQLVISYCAQDTEGLHGTIQEYAAEKQIDLTLFMALLRKLDFSRVQFEKRTEDYSAGQKKKVLLAGSLCQRAHLYIWDEPLNYIDVFSRIQIEELILKFRPTMILVEHDKMFMERIGGKTKQL